VVRWDAERAGRQLSRWRRVAREASMQSRRLRPPEVIGLLPAIEVLAWPQMAAAEPGGRAPGAGERGLAVGPEGGWSDAELAVASDRVALPGGVLRAETAAVAAATVLVGLGSGLLRAVRPAAGPSVVEGPVDRV
jgi:16S rRNA (uracil1498-N3)-methyltransferase